jgi:hypothetical protein
VAIVYVDKNAAGANNGTSWTDAFTLFASAVTGAGSAAAGDDIYWAQNNGETVAASITWAFAGTLAAPVRVFSVTSGTTTYAASTTFQISNTGTATNDLTIQGHAKFYGCYIRWPDNFTTLNGDQLQVFTDCYLEGNNATTNLLMADTGGGQLIIKGGTIDLSSASLGSPVVMASASTNTLNVIWDGVTLAASGVSSFGGTLLDCDSRMAYAEFRNCDFSKFTGTLVDVGDVESVYVKFVNCKLHASLTAVTNTWAHNVGQVEMIGSDDSGSNGELYRYYKSTYYGTITDDASNYINTNGAVIQASDGTNPISYKMVANTTGLEISESLVSPDIVGWINSTGSKTFSIEVLTDNVTLQDDEIWLEVDYLGASNSPIGSTVNTRMTNLTGGTPQNLADRFGASGQTWTSPGVTTDAPQKMTTASVTIGRVGPFRARVHVAKAAGVTVWINPRITVA